jgi:peptide-methionine (S)-S-oxide reductase
MFFLSDMLNKKIRLPKPEEALPGRATPIATAARHHVSKRPLRGPYPEGLEKAMFAMGCFWGAERLFWQTEGVWVTAVGYAGGYTPNPTYQEPAPVSPAMPKSYWWSTIPRSFPMPTF